MACPVVHVVVVQEESVIAVARHLRGGVAYLGLPYPAMKLLPTVDPRCVFAVEHVIVQ
jgi:hypothetical protein